MATAAPSTPAKALSAQWHLASGAISGAASVLILQPLDRKRSTVHREFVWARAVPVSSDPSPVVGQPELRRSWQASTDRSQRGSLVSTCLLRPRGIVRCAVIKTRLQQDASARPRTANALGLEAVSPLRRGLPPPPPRIAATVANVVKGEGILGLWRGTVPTLYRCAARTCLSEVESEVAENDADRVTPPRDPLTRRNVPGVSLYFLTLSRLRALVASSPTFRVPGTNTSGKAKLTPAGDLIVGSSARTGVGFVLMPFTLLKTLSEVGLSTGLSRGIHSGCGLI